MTITTISSREFNHDISKAKKAALLGPVFITDRGRPGHVLISFKEYKAITHQFENIADLLAMPGAAEIELTIPKRTDLPKAGDFL